MDDWMDDRTDDDSSGIKGCFIFHPQEFSYIRYKIMNFTGTDVENPQKTQKKEVLNDAKFGSQRLCLCSHTQGTGRPPASRCVVCLCAAVRDASVVGCGHVEIGGSCRAPPGEVASLCTCVVFDILPFWSWSSSRWIGPLWLMFSK